MLQCSLNEQATQRMNRKLRSFTELGVCPLMPHLLTTYPRAMYVLWGIYILEAPGADPHCLDGKPQAGSTFFFPTFTTGNGVNIFVAQAPPPHNYLC